MREETHTHSDPDWDRLTYGDYEKNGRGAALGRAVNDDILLFWALLWPNVGDNWTHFTGERRWCFVGALRIASVCHFNQPITSKTDFVARFQHNMHVRDGKLEDGNRVFIGCEQHSQLFSTAVDLQAGSERGLLCRTLRSKNGDFLSPRGKVPWSSYFEVAGPFGI